MFFLFAIVLAYYLLMWGAAHLLVHGSAEQQLDQAYHRRPAVGVVYWLLTVPLLCTGLLWVFSSRWSLSTVLLPAALVLLLLSGLAAAVYQRVAQVRWPLLAHAALLSLAAPWVLQRLWLGQQEEGILCQQYPFTIKAARRDYVGAGWSWDNEPTSYSITAFYQTSWGFDYYAGDLHLGDRPGPYVYGNSQQEVTGMGESFWQRVRSIQFSSDPIQGRLKLSPLLSDGKYNAFTERVELPAEQVVNFWLDTSLAQQKPPTPY